MGRAAVIVDIHTIRLIRQHVDLSAQFGEQALRRSGGRAVGAVQSDPHAIQSKGNRSFNVVNIVFYRVFRYRNPADIPALRRQIRRPIDVYKRQS